MEMVRSQLFDGITQQECERMFVCFGAREKSYEQGDVICEFVGGSKVVGVLLSGSADLIRLDVDGDRVILETMEEGGVFGEVFAFSGSNGDSTFIECRSDCRVMYLDYDQITKRCENACHHHSALVQNLFRLLSTKTLRLSERVEVLSRRSIREKLLCYFHQQQIKERSNKFTLPFSLSALADYISVDRSAMMREMKKLKEEGRIRTENRRITLLS
ncbi:MAG: Crp/Fnr family transcriptional regulator [Oscillospiraceae bacterium]|nr:Crp/Fnr family transcriptional regulator [Oscillospiraceae bacterium]MBR7146380.1 Crp/Fnr family transcriptional regulator [Oscillospiraceae bacterium]